MHPWFHALEVCQHWWPQSNSDVALVAEAIASGETSHFKTQAMTLCLSAYPMPAQKLLLESAMRIGSPLEQILESAEDLEWELPSQPHDRDVWAERHFLAGFAANRMEKYERADRHWICAESRQVSAQLIPSLHARVLLERGVEKLNQGFDTQAFDTTSHLLDDFKVDSMTRIRALAVRGLAAATLGNFSAMDCAWAEEKTIVDSFQNPSLLLTWKRRLAEGFVTRGRFHDALKLIDEGLLETTEMPSLQALFLNLKIETLLLRNELESADKALRELQRLLELKSMPANVVSIAQLQCELALRRRDFVRAREFSEQILLHDEHGKKLPAQVTAFVVSARLDLIAERFEDARHAIEKAIHISKEQGYAPLLIDAYFHAAGIAFATRDKLALRRYLEQARNIARSLKLELKENCFEYIIARLREPLVGPSLRPLLGLLTQGVRAVEIIYLLNYYGFGLDIKRNLILQQKPPQMIGEQELWEEWLQKEGLFWLPDDGLLFRNGGANSAFPMFAAHQASWCACLFS